MLTITQLALPGRPDDQAWLEYHGLGRVLNRDLAAGDGFDTSPESAWEAATRHSAEYPILRFLAHLDGVAVGYASLRRNLTDDPLTGHPFVYVEQAHRGRGIGAAVADRLANGVEATGLTLLQAWVMVQPDGEERLVPTSGSGSVPAAEPGIRFALRHGFTLEQVERVSRYDFAAPHIDPRQALAEAVGHAGDDYEVVLFEGHAPDDMIDDLAVLRVRMSTDPPAGGMVAVEEAWDAARLRERDTKLLVTNRFWRAVVRHVPSGRAVALSEIARDRGNPVAFLEQWDTIVAPEHRGRRLGVLVKAANLLQVRDAAPDAEAIITWNAEENRHMLSVNEALGFRQVLVEAALQRRL